MFFLVCNFVKVYLDFMFRQMSAETNRPLKVLIVDDEEPFRKVVSLVLKERAGYDVHECDSGECALEALRARSFDVVVLDYRMEPLSGLNVLQWMLEQKMDTPVIILTGAGSEHVAVEAMKLGAYDYIRKDFLEQHRLPVIINGVYERYLFKKEREQTDRMSKDRERNIALFEVVHGAISTSAEALRTTLSNIPSNIDRQRQNLQPIIDQDGQQFLDEMAKELKEEYNFLLVITKSLAELADVMYQKSRELQDSAPGKEAHSELKAIPEK